MRKSIILQSFQIPTIQYFSVTTFPLPVCNPSLVRFDDARSDISAFDLSEWELGFDISRDEASAAAVV
jgi:hypothetical protein